MRESTEVSKRHVDVVRKVNVKAYSKVLRKIRGDWSPRKDYLILWLQRLLDQANQKWKKKNPKN